MRLSKIGIVIALAMGSCSAFAAGTSGSPVQGGNGSVNINGTITTGTCVVSVDSTDQAFSLTQDAIKQAKPAQQLDEKYSTFTISGCSGTAVNVVMTPSKATSDPLFAFFNETNKGIRYQIVGENTGGQWSYSDTGSNISASTFVFPNNGVGRTITPDSDNATFKVKTRVTRLSGDVGVLPSSVTASYTYSFVYK
ncbi:TPA: hypothetical protein R8E83_005554 [Escherichia coli]|nr:hypothetical protein [Escherichia coli]